MRRKTVAATAAAVVLAAASWIVATDIHLKHGFRQISDGEPKLAVTASLGQPHGIVRCGNYGGTSMPNCVEEYAYVSLLTFTDVWTVDFDREGHVVRKYRYRSP